MHFMQLNAARKTMQLLQLNATQQISRHSMPPLKLKATHATQCCTLAAQTDLLQQKLSEPVYVGLTKHVLHMV